MSIALIAAMFVMAAGFMAARAFRLRRFDRVAAARRARKDALKRRHHFRGAADMELDMAPRPLPHERERPGASP